MPKLPPPYHVVLLFVAAAIVITLANLVSCARTETEPQAVHSGMAL